MHQKYRAAGFADEDADEVASFLRRARELGISRQAVDSFFALNKQLPADNDPKADRKRDSLLRNWFEKNGIPEHAQRGVNRWLNGHDREPAPRESVASWYREGDKSPAESGKRLEELRGMVKDRGSDYYRKPELRQEYQTLLAGGGAPAPNVGAAVTPSAAPAGGDAA